MPRAETEECSQQGKKQRVAVLRLCSRGSVSGLGGGAWQELTQESGPSPEAPGEVRSPPSSYVWQQTYFLPFPAQVSPPASEPSEVGQSSWQAPSKTCCWTDYVWHFQKLLSLSLACYSQP